MQPIQVESLKKREVVEGFHARFIHSQQVTLAYWEIEAGAALPEHHHIHEQVVNVLEGEFELTVQGDPVRLSAGSVFILPSEVRHSGHALTDCRILDVFHPVREDYR